MRACAESEVHQDSHRASAWNGSQRYVIDLAGRVEDRLTPFSISADGEVFVWGSAEFGQVGLGNNETQYLPVRIESLRDKGIGTKAFILRDSEVWPSHVFLWVAVDIACGLDHSVAISKHGRVWTWGYNIDGQLGHNSTEDESKPKEISSLRGKAVLRRMIYRVLIFVHRRENHSCCLRD